MENPIDIDIELIVPNGVLCLFSAWFYYELTTTIPHSYYIAIEKKRKIVLPDYPPIVLYYWQKNQYDLGISTYTKDGISIKIYDIEKSVCDAVKFRNKVGMDIAIEVVRNYVRRKDRNFDKITKYARQMRIETIMQNMIMPML
jgi:predicted transcriptional regulator of viral defense system